MPYFYENLRQPPYMRRLLLLFLLVTEICNGQGNIKQGLRAWYPFDGNTNDASGNNNNPTFNNATLTADRFGKPNSAYHFNGINNYMRIPNSPSLNPGNQITLSVWVRPTGFYYDICHASSILNKGAGNYQPGDYALRFDDALYTNAGGCDGGITDSIHQNFRGTGTTLAPYAPYVSKDHWYSVIYTNDGTTAKLYVDCELKYLVSYKEDFNNNLDLYIGRTNDNYFKFWMNGDLDDLRIYDRALTTAEITSICNMTADTVQKKAPVKVVELEKRPSELMKQVVVEHDSLTVTLYDNGEVDGDSVTLIYNDNVLATHLRLSTQPKTFRIKIAPGADARNELIMYAENLGSIPPNTALMVIYDGDKRYELNVRSTQSTNGAVSFKLKE
jgi:hypothetical protein